MDPNHGVTIRRAVQAATASTIKPFVLAVSGGLDSMTLLDAFARHAPERVACVATFDHGTGAAASRAAAFVHASSAEMALPCVAERVAGDLDVREGRENAWRFARYAFLRRVAAERGAHIAVAHTRDDQLETVLMRVMRGAGARGLAALYAPTDVVRPFLHLDRADIERHAVATGISWMNDPSNSSPEFFRNRIRRDVLPALSEAHPGLAADLLQISARAAQVRAELDAYVARELKPRVEQGVRLSVRSSELSSLGADSMTMVWGALAARVGLRLDRRGFVRIGEFLSRPRRRGTIPLSGRWCLRATPQDYILERTSFTPQL